jgi:hypothetical protein
MRAELSPVSSILDTDEVRAPGPASQPAARRLFQDDVFERAARRPLVALG